MKKPARSILIYIFAIAAVFLIIASLGLFDAPNDKELSYSQFLTLVSQTQSGKLASGTSATASATSATAAPSAGQSAGASASFFGASSRPGATVMSVDGKTIKAVSVTTDGVDHLLRGVFTGTTITTESFPANYDFFVYIPYDEVFRADIEEAAGTANPDEYAFEVVYSAAPSNTFVDNILPFLIPAALLVVFFIFIMRKQGGAGGAMNYGKSRARMSAPGGKNKKTFADVAGADEEKEDLAEVVEFLRNPQRFLSLGARIPKGVLLVGPPGTGKTLLAKAVAGEANVPFFSISGSDFVEMFVGVGASRVRDMFDTAKKNAPCIIFIDEIDAVGRQRGAGLGGGHDEREQTLNQLLVEMDGFNVNDSIIILAATNRVDILDPALLRPGRFDRHVIVNYPDVRGREDILKVHARGKPFDGSVDFNVLAKRTPGFTGADIENMLNEAAILTARRHKERIGMDEIEEAITRVIAGPEKRSRVITADDKLCTAYHEVGHAICAKLLPHCDPVHEVSIIQRGMAAGYTMTLPEKDTQHIFRGKMTDEIAMLLGGRAAESVLLDDISTGASNDIQRATDIAKSMVIKYGMSDKLGPVFLGGGEEIFVGKEFGHQRNYSEETAGIIDEEINRIVEEGFKKALGIIKEHKELLLHIAAVLIEREKLTGEEFDTLFDGGTLPDPPAPEPAPEPEPEATASEPDGVNPGFDGENDADPPDESEIHLM